MGWDWVGGIATRYGLDGPAIEFRWEARFSPSVQTRPGAHLASGKMGTGSYSGDEAAGGVNHRPPSKAKVK